MRNTLSGDQALFDEGAGWPLLAQSAGISTKKLQFFRRHRPRRDRFRQLLGNRLHLSDWI